MLMRKTSRKKKRRAGERGQAAVFLVLAMGLFLIGSMGFVVMARTYGFIVSPPKPLPMRRAPPAQ